eukprot:TRINITY_DN2068_c0_g3_i3.p2 TRINITY_DN2068_c0_g3~~TRINITY_DN2068_c0_g3_i3.p2  ORF type:complete len:204 (-),score=54.75 TRINITY_DN2068_c0_g3_i3:186-797(-)
MLEKDPQKRITIKEAINHTWMKGFRENAIEGITKGKSDDDFDEINDDFIENDQANAVATNMKKFLLDNKFDVNNIKPKDIVMKTPLITGKLESIHADSIFSPGGTGVATPQMEIQHRLQQRQNDILGKAAGLQQYLKGGKTQKEKEEQKVQSEQMGKAQVGKTQNRLKQLEGQIKKNQEESKQQAKEKQQVKSVLNSIKKLEI